MGIRVYSSIQVLSLISTSFEFLILEPIGAICLGLRSTFYQLIICFIPYSLDIYLQRHFHATPRVPVYRPAHLPFLTFYQFCPICRTKLLSSEQVDINHNFDKSDSQEAPFWGGVALDLQISQPISEIDLDTNPIFGIYVSLGVSMWPKINIIIIYF